MIFVRLYGGKGSRVLKAVTVVLLHLMRAQQLFCRNQLAVVASIVELRAAFWAAWMSFVDVMFQVRACSEVSASAKAAFYGRRFWICSARRLLR